MIEHVWRRARQARSLREVLVATDDRRIEEACRDFGARCIRTRSDHPTGSDRLGEVAAMLDDDIVVNIQGDEPLIEGFVIDAAVEALRDDPRVPMSTVVHAADPADLDDPNRVKVAIDRRGRALYFSRSAIPYAREARPATDRSHWQHVGLYAYRRPFLLELIRLPQTPAELSEGLEQLRVLEHGHAIRAATIEGWHSVPVDVPADVARVEAVLRANGSHA